MDWESYDLPNEYLRDKYRRFVEIFKEHFGEDRVSAVLYGAGISWVRNRLAYFGLPENEDGLKELMERSEEKDKIESIAVIVYYPTVIVENERGQTEPITDLFVKVYPFRGDGIFAIRSSLSKPQAVAGYAHSHLPRLYDRMLWQNWCLGSGPIRNTLRALSEDNPDMGMIGLLCLELDTLVATESIAGGPYFRMEGLHAGYTDVYSPQMSVNLTNTLRSLPGFYTTAAADWFKRFLKSGELGLKECNGKIQLSDSLENVLIKATNSFIRYLDAIHVPVTNFIYNPERPSYNQDTFQEFIFEDGELKTIRRQQSSASLFGSRGRKIITFKGKDFLFEIKGDTASENNAHSVWLFAPDTVLCMLYYYLIYINDRYLKLKNNK